MPARFRNTLGIAAVLGLAGVAAWAAFFAPAARRAAPPLASQAIDETTPLPTLAAALRESDARALTALMKRLTPKADERVPALSDAEARGWVEALGGLRTGFLKFGSYGRATAVTVTGRALRRFAVEPGPAIWFEAIRPAHDVLAAGLADTNLDVRATALVEVGQLWSWAPGRTLAPAEEHILFAWKDGFHAPVVRRLADPEPRARAAAVACLGRHPIDNAAAPALAYLEDPKSPEVRQQVLISFAGRPALLSEDAVLRHVYDKAGTIPETAELVLKTRGLTQEQISLGSMIFHPKADIRASVIPLLKQRQDIDPVVWLVQLTRDAEESVRLGALTALAARPSPEGGQRIAEMAANDASPTLRNAACKLLLPALGKTAALPPLPGSASLSPKAN